MDKDNYTPLELKVIGIIDSENRKGRPAYWGEAFRQTFTQRQEFMKIVNALVKRGVVTKETKSEALWTQRTWFDRFIE